MSMQNRETKKNISIQQVLTALLDMSNIFPATYLHRLSDLEGRDLEALRSVWPQVQASRRLALMEDLEELTDADTLVSFDSIAQMGLEDPDPRVRTVSIRMLWESEDNKLGPRLIDILNHDTDTAARAAAASTLGQFVYRGELEEIPEDLLHEVEENLLSAISSPEDTLVRRRALESMGFSSRKEVPGLIREAYEAGDPDWVSTALFAMGRSADQVWSPDVLRMLQSPKANIQLEAVRAAGNLEIEKARRTLLNILEEEAQDSEIRLAVIWSLSQIGGEEVRETLEQILEETDDEEEAEFVETALDNLSFTDDVGLFGLFDFADPEQTGQMKEYDNIESYLRAIEEEDSTDLSDKAQNKDADQGSDKEKDKKHNRHKKQ